MCAQKIEGLAQQMKQRALELGADLVGVAAVERWETPPPFDAARVFDYRPSGYGPTDLMPTARSVIVLGIGQLAGVMESNVSDARTTYAFGNFGYVHLNRVLNSICFDLARWLEARSHRTLPLGPVIGSRFSHEADADETANAPLYGVFSLKHAAVLSGIGRRAKNGLVATSRFGTRVRLAGLITAAVLGSDEPLEDDPCPPNCTICMDVCPTQAISHDGRVNHYRCSSDCGSRGTSREEIRENIRQIYPVDLPGFNYVPNDFRAIDSAGNRLCKVACMALCPLGQARNSDVLRRARHWETTNPKVVLSGFPNETARGSGYVLSGRM
jgi:epoxyqueuosine reductase QueG